MKRHNYESRDGGGILEALTTFVDNAEVGMYVSDYYTCEILLVNRKVASYLGESDVNSLIGKRCWSILNPGGESRCSFCPYEKLLDNNGKPLGPYSWETYQDAFGMWMKVINQAVNWTDGRLAHMVTFYDISETKTMQEQLSNLAFKDRLLNLKNDIRLEQDIQEAPVKPSLILFDILSLHKINEAYGRDMGDQLLRSVRDWLVGQDIPTSELYRIGGDEFCLAVKDMRPDALNELTGVISRRFAEPWIFLKDEKRLRIFSTASIAMIQGEYIQENEPPLTLIARTLKMAKEIKRVLVYDEAMNKAHKDMLRLELSLKKSIHEDMEGFDIHYQPIADPISGTWRGLEALCRWHSPELGHVSPGLFIPEVERIELIGAVGLWVLETAVRGCKDLGLDKYDGFFLDVNVSAAQFLDESLAETILAILECYRYPGEKLCLEITESTRFTFCDQSLRTIERLRNHGILVALDDFGTGYSSFINLRNLPVDIVKIEREFVTNIEKDEYYQYLFRVMVELAHTVNMKLIAEGVEDKMQMDILVNKGADCLQGYLFSEPLPSSALEKHLNRFNMGTIS